MFRLLIPQQQSAVSQAAKFFKNQRLEYNLREMKVEIFWENVFRFAAWCQCSNLRHQKSKLHTMGNGKQKGLKVIDGAGNPVKQLPLCLEEVPLYFGRDSLLKPEEAAGRNSLTRDSLMKVIKNVIIWVLVFSLSFLAKKEHHNGVVPGAPYP